MNSGVAMITASVAKVDDPKPNMTSHFPSVLDRYSSLGTFHAPRRENGRFVTKATAGARAS